MASGTVASVKLCGKGSQCPRVLTVKIEIMSACGGRTDLPGHALTSQHPTDAVISPTTAR
jgi:hypothetical protein